MHLVEVGTQSPVHAPPLHTKGQLSIVCQKPVLLHVCAFAPEHCADDGEQATHAPARHTAAWPEHDAPTVQLPVLSHARGTLPWQSLDPGTQAVQSPPMHEVEHGVSSHVPAELQ